MTKITQPPIKVLVIDDDDVSRELLTLLLTAQGYTVDAADSGEAALQHLQQSPNSPPGAILTDLQMPGISGSELAQQLRSACQVADSSQTLLLAMSGSWPDDATLRGYDDFLLKPFTMQDFAAALTKKTRAEVSTGVNHSPHSPACLDEDVYGKLAGSMQPGQLQQLYTLCLSDIEARIARMRAAVSNGDDALYRREAHAIKGGSGMLGATEIHTLAAAMEAQGLADANHVASLDEMLLSSERLRVILIAR